MPMIYEIYWHLSEVSLGCTKFAPVSLKWSRNGPFDARMLFFNPLSYPCIFRRKLSVDEFKGCIG